METLQLKQSAENTIIYATDISLQLTKVIGNPIMPRSHEDYRLILPFIKSLGGEGVESIPFGPGSVWRFVRGVHGKDPFTHEEIIGIRRGLKISTGVSGILFYICMYSIPYLDAESKSYALKIMGILFGGLYPVGLLEKTISLAQITYPSSREFSSKERSKILYKTLRSYFKKS